MLRLGRWSGLWQVGYALFGLHHRNGAMSLPYGCLFYFRDGSSCLCDGYKKYILFATWLEHEILEKVVCSPTYHLLATHTFDNHTQRLVLPSPPPFGGERSITLASRYSLVCVRLLLQVYLVVLKLSLPLSIDINR